MEKLETLNFSKNNIIFLLENIFQDLINVKDVNFSENQMEHIGKQFQNLTNIKRIDLSNNNISFIDTCAFKGLVVLNEIKLFNNKFEKDKKLALYLPESVQLLYLHDINENNIKLISNLVISIF